MTGCTPVRALITAAALAAAVFLAGCNAETMGLIGEKATRPIPDKLLAEIDNKNMDKASPILVRVFKQEAELEVWKQDRTGRFALLKTYPICRWSGDLGPKVKEGDRQAPEGFYSITPAQMNPNSGFYLSFNTGFPNAYDRAWNRSGSQLMVHGDCSSRGCYAMTDEQISEIYALGRESFFGGQTAFQFQAYPFRMNPTNMARHRNNPNMAFWKMIKEGNDAFETTKLEPKVSFCEKKYVFNAEKSPDAKRDPVFNASAKCPDYIVNDEIAEAVRDKQRQDELKTAQLITRGTPTAGSRAGIDGGMHPVFASKLPEGSAAIDKDVTDYAVASYMPAPGTIPSHATIPRAPDAAIAPVANTPEPVVAVATPATRTASANASAQPSEGFFSRLSRRVGFKSDDKDEAPAAQTAQPAAKPATPPVSQKPKTVEQAKASEPKASPSARVIPLDKSQQATTKPEQPAQAGPASASASTPAMAGAAPTVSSNFENRFSFR